MDRKTFEDLLRSHQDAVYGFACSLVGRNEDAEDVTQDVFVRLWSRREEIELPTVRYWLLKVCRNRCLDLLRRRKVREQARARADQISERGHVGIEITEEDGRERSLEVSDRGRGALHTEQRLDIERLVQAMEQLKEPHRSIILLREVHDLSYEEIAQTLELSLSAVKVYLHRARHRIREVFAESDSLSGIDESDDGLDQRGARA
jgi:RNA polymerase sigma-70 factor (ECF subfamily)